VGIARDVKYFGPREGAPPTYIYVPLLQQPFGGRLTIVARATHGQRLANDLRSLVASMNPNLPIISAQTLEDRTALGVVPQRVAASVSGVLGMVGVLLAALGIYGVTAYNVARRTREIGIRMALGAQRADVGRMVLGHGVILATVGSALGLVTAVGAGRVLSSFLLGVAPADAVTFATAAGFFALVGLAACYVPARRATRIDPVKALRHD